MRGNVKWHPALTTSCGLQTTGVSVSAALAYPEHHARRKEDRQSTLNHLGVMGANLPHSWKSRGNDSPPSTYVDSQLWTENTVDPQTELHRATCTRIWNICSRISCILLKRNNRPKWSHFCQAHHDLIPNLSWEWSFKPFWNFRVSTKEATSLIKRSAFPWTGGLA